MSQINAIYTTVSGGRVHIAADTKYIGSVDSYNNCFTQFFAWLFSLSMTVNFDGKARTVNKESYINLIQSLRQQEINDIGQCSIFRPIAEAATLPANNLKMRDVITSAARQALFIKLTRAISQGDTTKALLMIGKGAELDKAYFDRGQLCPSTGEDTSGLDEKSRYSFTVFQAPPILQAARKSNRAVCQFLKEAGANLTARGKQYTFKREITNVESRLEYRLTPHIEELNRCHCHASREEGYRPQLRERTIVNTQDSRSGEKHYQLNQDNCSIIELS